MTRYAQGTPESVMQATDAKMYATKSDKTLQLPKMTPKMMKAVERRNQKTPMPLPAMQQPMASRGGSPLRPAVMPKPMAKGGAVKKVVKAKMAKGGMPVKAMPKKK